MKLGPLDRGAGSLFAQVFALVLVAIVGAQAINLWIVFHLPPPTPNCAGSNAQRATGRRWWCAARR